MNKIIFTIIAFVISNVALANIDRNEFKDYSQVEIANDASEVIISLPDDLRQDILSKVEANFVKSEKQKYKDKAAEYSLYSEIYFTISEAILICHTQSIFGDKDCLTNELRKNIAESTIKMIVDNYASSIEVNSPIEDRIKDDLYFINYYFFMSRAFSQCNISDDAQRNECMANVSFLVEQVKFDSPVDLVDNK